jgi:hypothetical protein
MHYVEWFLRNDSKFNDSEKLLSQANKIQADVLKHNYSDMLTTISNLALTYLSQEKYEEAMRLEE